MFFFVSSDIKPEFIGNEELNASDSPHLLKVIESFKPNVFNSGNVYNQKFGKFSPPRKSSSSFLPIPPIIGFIYIIIISLLAAIFFCVILSVLVNPIASSHFHNAPQQNLTQNNYSLPAPTMQANSYDASSSFQNPPAVVNNFNNFDQSNQFQMQYQQQQSFDYQAGGHIQQQQQFMGQSSVNNGSSSAYQHSINDLLVQPTVTLQQNLFSNSQDSAVAAVNQSVSFKKIE